VLGEIREHSNPKRYNDTLTNFQLALNVYFLNTTYYKENLDMLLNCCYVFYDLLQSLSDRGFLVERTNTNDKSWIDNRSSNDKSDRAGKSRQLDGYAVSYHPCTYCGKNHSSSMCKLINHPEASKWVNSASYRCMETRLVMRRMRDQKKQIVLAVTTPSVQKMSTRHLINVWRHGW
jgi:hypothetical protein